MLDKNLENLTLFSAQHPTLTPICLDLTDWTKTKETIQSLPAFQILVNCAGVSVVAPFLQTTQSHCDASFGTNVKSVFVVSQAFVQGIPAGEGGAILNMSSLASQRYFSYSGAYSPSKAGLDMVTKVMAVELGRLGIRVNSLHPGCVDTELLHENMKIIQGLSGDEEIDASVIRTPFLGTEGGGPVVSMGQVVDAALFLLSSRASGGTTGQHVFLDNGYSAA